MERISLSLPFTTFVFSFLLATLSCSVAQKTSDHSEGHESYYQLVEKVNPAVVQLTVDGFGSPRKALREQSSLFSRNIQTGSGVLVDSTGYIITNAHVVAGARSIQVLLPPSANYNPQENSVLRAKGNILEAEIIGIDNETDVGLIKIPDGDYQYLKFGDSDNLRPGQRVFAFGSPLGLENSVSMGIISSTARQLQPEDPMIYIQTDAPINPGNSGGPLVNTNGEIVGLNTLNVSLSGGSQGLGFAGPSNIIHEIYKQLRKDRRVERGIIKVHAQTIGPRLAKSLDLKNYYRVILGDVVPGGPADFVGLKPGDIIISLDGKRLENARQMNVNIYGKTIGSTVTLEVFRDGEIFERNVEVVQREDQQAQFMNYVDPQKNVVEELGILAIDLNRELRQMLPPLRKRGGVLVAASNGKSRVIGDALQPGDVIYQLDSTFIKSFKEFNEMLEELSAPTNIILQVERGGTLMYLSYEFD